MDKRLEDIERLHRNHLLRLFRKTQRRTQPRHGMRFLRVALSVLFMAGLLWAHSRFGEIGVVVLSLLVLLGFSHPLWLLFPRGPKRRPVSPTVIRKVVSGQPSSQRARRLTGRDNGSVSTRSV